MELGMLMMPLHRPERPFLTVLREDQDAIILADELGFAEVYVGEHYSNKPEQITSPFIFLATLIERTKRIKLGTGVINLPQQHPAIVAAHAAMFDQLAQGRFIFGIGPGGSPGDFEMFKLNNPPDRPKMMQESIETILKIWTQEPPYEFPGGYWDFQIKDAYRSDLGVGVMARPYQTPHPPIAVSIMSPRSSSARTAGAHGWIPISANFTPACHVKTHWEAYAEGCEAAGRRPEPAIWRAARSILVTESDAEAEDYLADPDNALAFYFNYLRTVLLDADFGALLKDDPSHARRGDHDRIHAGRDGRGRQPPHRDREACGLSRRGRRVRHPDRDRPRLGRRGSLAALHAPARRRSRPAPVTGARNGSGQLRSRHPRRHGGHRGRHGRL